MLEAGYDPAPAILVSMSSHCRLPAALMQDDQHVSKSHQHMKGLHMRDNIREGCWVRSGESCGSPAKNGEVTRVIKALAEGDHEPSQQLGCPATATDH